MGGLDRPHLTKAAVGRRVLERSPDMSIAFIDLQAIVGQMQFRQVRQHSEESTESRCRQIRAVQNERVQAR